MFQQTLFCTPEQTRKALELGAPLKPYTANGYVESGCAEIPTAEQMIGWLEECSMFCEIRHYEYFYHSYVNDTYLGHFASRKAATLAAIDAALEYLSNKSYE